jgi:hypothetical protein
VPSAATSQSRNLAIAGIVIVAVVTLIGVVAVTVLVRSSRQAAHERAGAEATSLAEHSGWLATGDAFGGYIQLLRDAEDPEIRTISTPSDQRTAAMRRQLELNTNRFSGLAVVGLDGRLLAATDGTLLDAPNSAAYAAVRANHGNANSDIVLTAPGQPGHVDYGTILIDPGGDAWAVLVARAAPDVLWMSTLAASVDGSENIIINSQGALAAGVAASDIGKAWQGRSWSGNTIRTDVTGVDSICSLHAIARDTQIDHGWSVASCLPADRVLAGFGGIPWADVALLAAAIVVASPASLFVLGMITRREPPVPTEEATIEDEADEEATPSAGAAPQQPLMPETNVDARSLIAAYEARSARLASQLRESIQARILVVSSRVEEAIETESGDPILAEAMLRRAAQELDDLNEHELRAMGQEMYPDLVRLGLPAALRALSKETAALIEVEVDADAAADSVDDASERAIGTPRRLALYRLVQESLGAIAGCGIPSCVVELRRGQDGIWLAIKAPNERSMPLDSTPLRASVITIEVLGGEVTIEVGEEVIEIVAEFAESGNHAQIEREGTPASPDQPADEEDIIDADGVEPRIPSTAA